MTRVTFGLEAANHFLQAELGHFAECSRASSNGLLLPTTLLKPTLKWLSLLVQHVLNQQQSTDIRSLFFILDSVGRLWNSISGLCDERWTFSLAQRDTDYCWDTLVKAFFSFFLFFETFIWTTAFHLDNFWNFCSDSHFCADLFFSSSACGRPCDSLKRRREIRVKLPL